MPSCTGSTSTAFRLSSCSWWRSCRCSRRSIPRDIFATNCSIESSRPTSCVSTSSFFICSSSPCCWSPSRGTLDCSGRPSVPRRWRPLRSWISTVRMSRWRLRGSTSCSPSRVASSRCSDCSCSINPAWGRSATRTTSPSLCSPALLHISRLRWRPQRSCWSSLALVPRLGWPRCTPGSLTPIARRHHRSARCCPVPS